MTFKITSLYGVIASFLIVFALVGCNHDVYIDDSAGNSSEKLLEIPDGGEDTFRFSTEALVSVNITFDDKFDCVKYLPSGDVYGKYSDMTSITLFDKRTTQPFITRLSVSNAEGSFDVTGSMSGDITVKSISNIRGVDICGTIELVYSYKTESVAFRIGSSFSEPPVLKVRQIIYNQPLLTARSKKNNYQQVENRTDKVINETQMPGDYCQIYIHFFRKTPGYPVDFDGMEVDIPTYDPILGDGGFCGVKTELKFAGEHISPLDNALPAGESFWKEVKVEVPAKTRVITIFEFSFIEIKALATLVAENPRNGAEVLIDIDLLVQQPIGYSVSFRSESL